MAESNLARAEDSLDWTTRMFVKGYTSKADAVAEQLALKKARFALEHTQSKLKVLLDYTKDKTIKALTGLVETARASELAKAGGARTRAVGPEEADGPDQALHRRCSRRWPHRVRLADRDRGSHA